MKYKFIYKFVSSLSQLYVIEQTSARMYV